MTSSLHWFVEYKSGMCLSTLSYDPFNFGQGELVVPSAFNLIFWEIYEEVLEIKSVNSETFDMCIFPLHS